MKEPISAAKMCKAGNREGGSFVHLYWLDFLDAQITWDAILYSILNRILDKCSTL